MTFASVRQQCAQVYSRVTGCAHRAKRKSTPVWNAMIAWAFLSVVHYTMVLSRTHGDTGQNLYDTFTALHPRHDHIFLSGHFPGPAAWSECSWQPHSLDAAVGIDDCRFIRRDNYVGTRSGMRCTGEQSGVSSLNSRTGHSVTSHFFTNCTQIYCSIDWSLHFSVKNHKTSMHAPISFHQDSAALSQSIPSAYAGKFSRCCFMWLAFMCSESHCKNNSWYLFIYCLVFIIYIFIFLTADAFLLWRSWGGGEGIAEEVAKTRDTKRA